MTAQVFLFDVFFEKDPHLNVVEGVSNDVFSTISGGKYDQSLLYLFGVTLTILFAGIAFKKGTFGVRTHTIKKETDPENKFLALTLFSLISA